MNRENSTNSGRPWHNRVLSACSISSGSPRAAELAARLGFDAVWIELEHCSFNLATAEMACTAVEAGGAIPLVRAEGWRREHVLQAVEIGGKIIVVPMINSAEMARDVVAAGKFPPIGQRGFNTRSRGAGLGLKPVVESLNEANQQVTLLPQIETLEAVENLEAILAVNGIGGVFIGLGDLSSALGCPGEFTNPKLIDVASSCIAKARAAGSHAGVLVPPGPLLKASLAAGADLCVFASDFGSMIQDWRAQLKGWRES